LTKFLFSNQGETSLRLFTEIENNLERNYLIVEPLGEFAISQIEPDSTRNAVEISIQCGLMPMLDEIGNIDFNWLSAFPLGLELEENLLIKNESGLIKISIPISFSFHIIPFKILMPNVEPSEEAKTLQSISFGSVVDFS
jgi:hypothetical protein